jgi:hypothetical protein
MKHKRRGAKSARFARSSRLFFRGGNRRGPHPAMGAERRFAAFAPVEDSVPDPVRFYSVPRDSYKWDPPGRAEIGALSRRNGHIATSISREMVASNRVARVGGSRSGRGC